MKLKFAFIILVLGVVAAVFFVGCVEKPPSVPTATPTPSPKTELSLGDSVIVNDISFVVVKYEFADSFVDEFNSTQSPKEGANFLWLYVKAMNVGEVAQSIPQNYDVSILYKDTEITRYTRWGFEEREMYAYAIAGFGKIYPDVSEEGWIIYEVPKGIDISQAKISVEFEKGKSMTWSLAS